MRVALVALTLAMLSGCTVSLKTHALVAVTANEVIAAAGEFVQAEMQDDFEDAGGESASEETRLMLDRKWDPKIEVYKRAVDVHRAYVRSIHEANEADDVSLLQAPARELLAQWRRIADLGEELHFPVISPPDWLVKLGKEKP